MSKLEMAIGGKTAGRFTFRVNGYVSGGECISAFTESADWPGVEECFARVTVQPGSMGVTLNGGAFLVKVSLLERHADLRVALMEFAQPVDRYFASGFVERYAQLWRLADEPYTARVIDAGCDLDGDWFEAGSTR